MTQTIVKRSARLLLAALACTLVAGSRSTTAVKIQSIYSFTGGADGATPGPAPLIDPATRIVYGVTFAGGANQDGTIYALLPPSGTVRTWTEKTVWSFTGGADGAAPVGSLIEDSNGALYGTASGGGAFHLGAVFMLSPPPSGQTTWTETTLYNFSLHDGGNPSAGLAADANGVLYGTTASYGDNRFGTVFSLAPPPAGQTAWSEATLWTFTNGPDGGSPTSGLVIDTAGNLYGTTSHGGINPLGGTVFELSPSGGGGPWTETTLWSFSGPEGLHPTAALTPGPGGSLYGTTAFGGANGQGTAFQLSPPATGGAGWTQTVLCSFSPSSGGVFPFSPLLADAKGSLFGTTYGFINQVYTLTPPTVFRLMPPQGNAGWTVSTVTSLDAKLVGQNVAGGLATDGLGRLYGSVILGKPHGKSVAPGGIFEVFGSGFIPFKK